MRSIGYFLAVCSFAQFLAACYVDGRGFDFFNGGICTGFFAFTCIIFSDERKAK